jgi:hypothetical protein
MMIEKSINKLNKIELSSGAFMAIGATAIVSHVPTAPLVGAIFATVLSLPVFISAVINFYNIKKDNKTFLDNGLFGGLYKKLMTKQITQYVDDSENTTEQKYKLVFLKEYLQAHKISGLKDLFHSDQIEKWNKAISPDYKQCSIYAYLYNLEVNQKLSGYKRLDISDIFDEDKNSAEKIAISQKVYQNFKNEGLLGYQLRYPSSDNLTIFAELSDYTLTNKDVDMMQKTINNCKNGRTPATIWSGSNILPVLSALALKNPEHNQFLQEYLKANEAPKNWIEHLETMRNRGNLYSKITSDLAINDVNDENEMDDSTTPAFKL